MGVPAALKRIVDHVPANSYTDPVLSDIEIQPDNNHRNMVILGLLVHQGVQSGELQMEVSRINLNEKTVYVPSTSKSNRRILSLLPAQILSLQEYLLVVRALLKPKGNELFPSSMRNIIVQLVEELQGINPIVTKTMHLGFCYYNWLKEHNKRRFSIWQA